ncbi:LysR family transcriptional regulator [Anaerolentibacter hominis]|uniref:LysR family transcriptional regulator n=1 Tax=Anaerolentibacter hominis TaxID=3079009 RepID=UPI0031B850AB
MEHNLSLYRAFHAVARTGNISHAAKELFVSQPAVSKAISKLEESFHVALFNRGARGVSLTPAGKILYDYTTTAFSALSKAEEAMNQIQNLELGQIRIGVSTTLCKYMLLPFLSRFIRENPHIKITIHCQSTFHTLKLIEKNELDIGLVGRPEKLGNMDFYHLETIRDIFVVSQTCLDTLCTRGLLSEYETADSEALFRCGNLMMLDRENITRIYIDNYLRARQLEVNEVLEISNMDLLIEFAKIGLGIACVIGNFVEEELKTGELIEIPLSEPIPPRELGFVHNKNAVLSDAAKYFLTSYTSSGV